MSLIGQLTNAVQNNDLDLIQSLLKQGVPINELDTSGEGVLHWAARAGHVELIKLFIAEGANIQIVNAKGETPLDKAQRCANYRARVILRTNGAHDPLYEAMRVAYANRPEAPPTPLSGLVWELSQKYLNGLDYPGLRKSKILTLRLS